jgi:hypothetical protein
MIRTTHFYFIGKLGVILLIGACMTLGLGKNLSVPMVVASGVMLILLSFADTASARPQTEPAKNPDIEDPYAPTKPAPDSTAAQAPEVITPADKMETATDAEPSTTAPSPSPTPTPPRHALTSNAEPNPAVENTEFRNANGEVIFIERDIEVAEKDQRRTSEFEVSTIAPYRARRAGTGTLISVGYSMYTPFNYKPSFVINQSYNSYYGSGAPGAPEASYVYKKNFSLGSFGLGLKAGMLTATTKNASLTVVPIRFGASYYMDNLFAEPRIVPYLGGGAYTGFYKESLKGQSVSGNSSVSYYYAVGLEVQLNWFDDYGSKYSYEDFGMENAFLYVEAEGLGGDSSGNSPDLSNPFYVNAGLRMEF